jgi:tetratricopeptide (TPR) repeat protein
MREEVCSKCGFRFPLNSLYEVNQKNYCEPCGNAALAQLQQSNTPVDVRKKIDPSVCAKCGADADSGELEKKGTIPYCPKCLDLLYHRQFPFWLAGSLFALLILLAAALVHSNRYFAVARDLYRGERMVSARQYDKAAPLLLPSVEIAPQCDKCVLLYAKAAILSGDPWSATLAVKGHNRGYFSNPNDTLAIEVKQLFDRINPALELTLSARLKYSKKDYEGGIKDLQEAKRIYPELGSYLDVAIDSAKANLAFDAKDYDGFLSLEQALMQRYPEDPSIVGGVASALACKYVTTGDENYKTQALAMFARAKTLAVSRSQQEAFAEFSERILFRINSKEIIDTEEYNRRFRNGGKEPLQ